MKFRKFLTRPIAGLLSVMAFSLVISSCNKDDDDARTPVASLMAFNLIPDQTGVSFTLSGNLLPGGALGFTNYTGAYLNIFPGTRSVISYGLQANTGLDTTTYSFSDSMYYSLFAVGANNNYKNVVVKDNFDGLNANSGMAYVRYINAIPDSSTSTVMMTSGGSNVVNNNTKYSQFSDFVSVAPGQLGISISNNTNINASRDITVQQQKAYTVLFAGMPNATDTTKKVQIRFIENGTLTD